MEHTFQVHGMTCEHCETTIKKAVLRLDAHAQIQVERSHDKVVVQTEQRRETVAHAVAEEGYAVA